MVYVKLDTVTISICVVEIHCDSVVDLLNAYYLNRSYADKPYVELITPVARFDKKIVLTKFNSN